MHCFDRSFNYRPTHDELRDLVQLDGFSSLTEFYDYHLGTSIQKMRSQGVEFKAVEKELIIYGELPPGPLRKELAYRTSPEVKKRLGI